VDVERFRALFEPKGIIVAGASSHPGKFGFVAAHNILAHGYPGHVFLTNREGGTILDETAYRPFDEIPDGAAELVCGCTPPSSLPERLTSCARKGVKAAFVSSAGFGEAGEEVVSPSARSPIFAQSSGSSSRGRTGRASSPRRDGFARRSSRRSRRPRASRWRASRAASCRPSSTTRARPGSA
jgi:acetyltransferase